MCSCAVLWFGHGFLPCHQHASCLTCSPGSPGSPAHPLPCCCPLQLSTNGSVLVLAAGTPTVPRPRASSTSLWCEVSSCAVPRSGALHSGGGGYYPARLVAVANLQAAFLHLLGRQQCPHTEHWRAAITAACLCALCPPSPRPARGGPLLLPLPVRLDV